MLASLVRTGLNGAWSCVSLSTISVIIEVIIVEFISLTVAALERISVECTARISSLYGTHFKTSIILSEVFCQSHSQGPGDGKMRDPGNEITLLILRPFQLQQKYYANCGYKHDKTTHVVKLWLMTYISYASTYILRSDGWIKYNKI